MKNITALYALFLLTFVFAANSFAQETEAAASSGLTGIALPAGAHRVLPGSVPAEIDATLDKIIEAGNGRLRKGGREVFVWADAGYSKANANTTVGRLTGSLQADGWQYSVEGDENGITLFTLVKTAPARRVLIGFYGATDEALVVAWMEVLSGNGGGVANHSSAQNTGGGGVVGTWTNGTMSTMGDKNMTTGAITASNGSTFKYVFNADGSFEFVGYMQSTQYGCTTGLFNDKRGRYEISGAQITFAPSKNFWRNTYSCAPNSNKEKNHTLERETYTWRNKTDEYGKPFVCLANEKGETCYRKE